MDNNNTRAKVVNAHNILLSCQNVPAIFIPGDKLYVIKLIVEVDVCA